MKPFEVDIKVRFADVDHAKVVYYPVFFHYFHIAYEELFEQVLSASYPEVLEEMRVGYPSVHVEADYSSPARFGDVLTVAISCMRVGTSSVTFRYRARRKSDDVECAVGRVTACCVDMDKFAARPIPDEHRELFERMLET